MKKVWAYLVDYQRKHFDLRMYGVIALFIAICISINYRFDFEDSIIDSYTGEPIKWLWMFLFHSFPFISVCFIIYAFGKERTWLTSGNFWLKVFVGFGFLALDRSFYGFRIWFADLPRLEYHFIMRCINWASSLILVVIPLLILYPLLERGEEMLLLHQYIQELSSLAFFYLLTQFLFFNILRTLESSFFWE